MKLKTKSSKIEEINFKYEVGDFVVLKINDNRLIKCQVLERANKEKGKPYYRVDWTISGYQQILNSVFVCENAIKEVINGMEI